jgi:mannose-6-phosphate isomerase-like protein (cupin superfamily)
MSEPQTENVQQGEGWSTANLADLGEGPGFRKIRGALGVNAFGINAIVLPPSYSTNLHFHDEQEELYFVHSGRIAIEFGDGSEQVLEPGGLAWVDAPTHRRLRNISESEEAVYVCVGGKNGYVGRDGQLAPGETHRH